MIVEILPKENLVGVLYCVSQPWSPAPERWVIEVQEGGDICKLMLIHVDVLQKLTQYCKEIILQLKINKFKFKNKFLKKGKKIKENIWFKRPVGLVYRRVRRNRESTLKGHVQNLTHYKRHHGSSNFKAPCVRSTCWALSSCMASQETTGTQTLAIAMM